MPVATLTITSRTYGSWSLRGWLLCRFAGLDVELLPQSLDDEATRDELLGRSPSFRVPLLEHGGVRVWDVLAIAEYLHELRPETGLLPPDPVARARCRAICGEMHSGFACLRSALPMNLKAHHPGFGVFSAARADIDRVLEIWRECLAESGGPFLFGARPTVADAMFAPVCTRFVTYDVRLEGACLRYCETLLDLDEMREWTTAALAEEEALPELEMEF